MLEKEAEEMLDNLKYQCLGCAYSIRVNDFKGSKLIGNHLECEFENIYPLLSYGFNFQNFIDDKKVCPFRKFSLVNLPLLNVNMWKI